MIEARERVVLVQQRSEIELPNESFLVTASTGEKVSRWSDTLKKKYLFSSTYLMHDVKNIFLFYFAITDVILYGWYLKPRYCKTKAKSHMINNFFCIFLLLLIINYSAITECRIA